MLRKVLSVIPFAQTCAPARWLDAYIHRSSGGLRVIAFRTPDFGGVGMTKGVTPRRTAGRTLPAEGGHIDSGREST